MASFRSTKLKITIGYILLLAILLFSLVFVHQEMETLSAADDQRIAFGNNPVLYPLLSNHRVLLF